MSLLLDALKRAAQEKLEKQRQDENGAGDSGTAADAALTLDITDAPPAGGELQGAQDSRLDATAASHTDLRLHRADVLASELQAFMGGAPTEQQSRRAANEPADKKDAAGREKPAPGPAAFAPAVSPAAAARVFKNKHAGIRSKQVMLLAGAGGALVLIIAFYAVYVHSLNRSNVRVDRLLAGVPAPAADPVPAGTFGVEAGLLAEREPRPVAPQTAADKSAPAAAPAETDLFADNPAPVQSQTQNTAPRGTTPRLRVSKSNQEALHDILLRAYNAYQSGDIAAAEANYRHALARAPQNRDALLGFAATAVQQGDYAAAMESYATLLELDPNDDLALAGISTLQQDVQGVSADESLLKRLLLKRPDSAQLHFALGNLHAAAADWPKAQSAYFDAHRYDAQNPDYAYNLAISLEHLQQPAMALRYYQLAVTLAAARKPNFDPAQAAARVSVLQPQQDPAADAR